jgi:hypothetical protein
MLLILEISSYFAHRVKRFEIVCGSMRQAQSTSPNPEGAIMEGRIQFLESHAPAAAVGSWTF